METHVVDKNAGGELSGEPHRENNRYERQQTSPLHGRPADAAPLEEPAGHRQTNQRQRASHGNRQRPRPIPLRRSEPEPVKRDKRGGKQSKRRTAGEYSSRTAAEQSQHEG